jgi:hypothetical protein
MSTKVNREEGEMLNENDKVEWKEKIEAMSQMEMAKLYRFAPAGHPVFDSGNDLYDFFIDSFKRKGGITSEISKTLGW